MKHLLCLFSVFLLSISAFAQNEWDTVLSHYGKICDECILLREKIAKGETVTEAELTEVQARMAEMQKTVNCAQTTMSEEQKAKFKAIRDKYEVRFGLRKSVVAENVDYIDLGLSVLWSTCNLGASSPEDSGYYLSWGEVEPKKKYDISNYRYARIDTLTMKPTFIKYLPGQELNQEDDAAFVIKGPEWKIPTDYELEELYDNCTWARDTLNGSPGWRATSTVEGFNDKSIFFPLPGLNGSFRTCGKTGYYYSSKLGNPFFVRSLIFKDKVYIAPYRCYDGRSIRPVKVK